MQIFVKTAGFRKEHEYQWACNTPAPSGSGPFSRAKALPESLIKAVELGSLEDQSLVLCRRGEELVVLITDLGTVSRRDFRDRRISNAVAWVGNVRDEPTFRSLAARALTDWAGLERRVDQAIEPADTGELGFRPNFDSLAELAHVRDQSGIEAKCEVKRRCRVAPDTPEARKELAGELEREALPPGDGPLVVVTKYREIRFFREHGVYRGLSDLVSEATELGEFGLGGRLPTGLAWIKVPSAMKKHSWMWVLVLVGFLVILSMLFGRNSSVSDGVQNGVVPATLDADAKAEGDKR